MAPCRALLALALCLLAGAATARPMVSRSLAQQAATCPAGYQQGSGPQAGVNALCSKHQDGCYMYGASCVCPPTSWKDNQAQCPAGCSLTGQQPFFNEGKCFCDAPPSNCVPAETAAAARPRVSRSLAQQAATCPAGYQQGSGPQSGINALCAEHQDGCYMYGASCVCPPTAWKDNQAQCPDGCSLTGQKPFFNEGKCFCDAPPAGCVAAGAVCPAGYQQGSGVGAGVNALCSKHQDGCYMYGNSCVCPPASWKDNQAQCPAGCSLTGQQPFFNEGKCFCDAPPANCVAA